jgi:foldase protein PrsA
MKEFLKKNIAFISLAVIVIIATFVLIFTMGGNSGVVARVNNQEITKDQFYDKLVEGYGKDVLDGMITDKIIELESEKNKVTVTDAEIQDEIKKMAESYGGEAAFNQQLQQAGVTTESMKADVTKYLKIVKLLGSKISVTDEEISSYFSENKASFAQAEQVEASHILVADEATAKEVKKKLDEGGDFAKLAAEYSTDTQSAQNGGSLGYFGRGEMVEAFENAAFSMDINQISDPIKTDFGYHIIKVTGKKAAQEATLENSKAKIEETLKNNKVNTEYSSWLTEKKAEYNITNSLEKK